MADKEHICERMVMVIEEKRTSVMSFEQKAADAGVKLSVGYLRKASKNDTNIGVDIVEYFLGQYPDINAEWLITGHGRKLKDAGKHTAATKNDEAAVNREREELFRDLETFRNMATDQLKIIATMSQSKGVEQG